MGVELLDLPEVRRQQPRYSRAKYHQMGELGLLPEKTELLYAADESISPLCAPEFALTLKEILPR